jgi:hypothetical protein
VKPHASIRKVKPRKPINPAKKVANVAAYRALVRRLAAKLNPTPKDTKP